ncbi:Peroxisomal membrane signal receptor PTS1 [Apophysomyces ossiformis]|uniref:Peroxisomal membrane signal receptor PTS1 n=1 Tax=Apophysomyces ossiformis TaxID=679940 RepID=A0A8H7BWN1_9FUNG|nr:Peroxisomal membrane signal receptor PTS1 [Apophysomyces ossiformis]
MMNGADCSGGANPLSQMLKQFNQDRSLQRDRFGEPAESSAGPSSIRTARQAPLQRHDGMIDEFFGQEPQQQQRPMGRVHTNNFEFSALQRELDSIRHGPPANWASEFGPHQQQGEALTREEQAAMEKAFQESRAAAGPMQSASVWRDEFMNHPDVVQMNPAQLAEFERAFERHFDWAGEFSAQDKGKGKIVELNDATWEEQFAAFDAQGETEDEMARKVEEAAAAQDPNMFDQFESIWQDIRDQMAEGGEEDWEDEFNNFNPTMYKPDLGEYVFEVENPYLDSLDPMSEGLRMVEQGGSLNNIALAFEAVVQREPANSEAWMQLGNIQAQNEKEEPAIRALEKAIEVNPGNLPALMSLAVSYTNESYDQAAYQTLERWITERYPDIVRAKPLPEATSPFELHDRVTELFLSAARQAPDGQLMDPDVQVGLGVLFYGSGDLEKAIDCFFTALKGRPDDYLLWNRLGATLANNGRSEEAIDAYHRALELRPSFVRARYNLGVSCINIGCYKEAAEHLLTGLSMHKRGDHDAEEGVNVSSNLWEMLRKTFIMMDRRDLADKAMAGADINQFRVEFEF